MTTGSVAFVGCGPGAADLLTLRAARFLAEADIVVWSASLIDAEAVDAHARPGTEIVAWPPATQSDVLAVYERARSEGLRVVRLKGGDPGVFGALEPELGAVRELGMAWEIVPGVSSVSAAAAELGREVASEGAPLLLVAVGDVADEAPDGHSVHRASPHAERPVAEYGASVGAAVFGAGRDPGLVERALLARGLPAATPCAVAVGVSRPAQIIAACTLGELAEHLADLGRGAQTLVIAAPTLAGDVGREAH